MNFQYQRIINYSNLGTTNEHDDRASRPSTSRGSGGGYSDRHGFNKKVTFKANNRGGNNFRRSWDNGKTDLIRDQFDSEVSNRNGQGQPRNNSGRRYLNIIISNLLLKYNLRYS